MKKFFAVLLLSLFTVFSSAYFPISADPFPVPVALVDESVYRFLEASVRMRDSGNRRSGWLGSGGVVFQDDDYAYVLSCAHIFNDDSKKTCGIELFYKDGKKLKESLLYPAEILGINFKEDLSFIKFKADYKIQYVKIAPADYNFIKDTIFISTGCDQNLNYLAAYKVRFYNFTDINMGDFHCDKCNGTHSFVKSMITTAYNGGRHGRSGGPLISYEGYLLGVLSRGSEIEQGTGYSYFIKPEDIHAYAKKLGLNFLLENPLLKNAKVYTKHGEFPAIEYIPTP